MTLNPEQQQAIQKTEGPLLVLAGAGSGKTRVVTYRIAHLLEKGVSPSKILGLTFTNKAATEMKERVRQLTQSQVLICTFHGLGSRILRESIHFLGYHHSFTIYDEEDVERLLKSCLDSLPKSEIKKVRSEISLLKNRFIGPEQEEEVAKINSFIPQIYRNYQAKLMACHAVDYDDLLFLTARLFQEHPQVLKLYQDRWSYLMIDEYQDTNSLQYHIVNQLAAQHNNVCVVGDPDQSIYSWRGADISNIMDFELDYPNATVIRLNQNYRSTTNILNGANGLIAHNRNRYEKKLWSCLGEGKKIQIVRCDDELIEAKFVAEKIAQHHRENHLPLNQAVVFYRTNAQSRVFEDLFLQYRIPYVIVGGISFYQRREIKDLLAWLRIIYSGADLISFERTINLPKRGIGDTTLEKIKTAAAQHSKTVFAYCETVVEEFSDIKLTAQQRKGLQEYVSIVRELKTLSHQVNLADLIIGIIDKTNYRAHLELDPDTLRERIENLNALIAKAVEWNEGHADLVLPKFLEELSLKTSLDEASEGEQIEKVHLMTIHNGKGLEFSLTFLVGMEEDLFPHVNSRDDNDAQEEERRLCYVGMTRAKEYLYLTHVVSRFIWGVRRSQRASRFLREIPLEFIEKQTITGPSGRSSMSIPARIPARQTVASKSFQAPVKPAIKPEQPREALAQGSLVFHPEFGIGQIKEVSQGTAGLTYKVFFQKDQSERSLVAQYTQLTLL